MSSTPTVPAEWLLKVYAEVEALAKAYDADVDRLENQRKQAKGQTRQEVQGQIDSRRRQLTRDLKGGEAISAGMLMSGLVDYASIWVHADLPRSEDARGAYMKAVQEASSQGVELPPDLKPVLDADLSAFPDHSGVGLEVTFMLQRPWYSKDDRTFHVLDNPVRKDLVFGVPYMAAASWKGMLRWAYHMTTGLIGPEPEDNEDKRRRTRATELHLFGNEKDEKNDFRQGALAFYPTWFDKISFEMINPHSRARRAGTQPIYYEVVPPGSKAALRLLYAPLPGAAERDGVKSAEAIEKLLDATESLLTTYGMSAKRTVGWGTAKIERWKGFRKDRAPIEKTTLQEFKEALRSWLAPDGKAS